MGGVLKESFYDWQDDELEIKDGQSILDALRDNRIVDIDIGPKGLRLVEECDRYHGATLTKEQAKRLIDELEDLCANL
jgi:hypothetical protein